MLLLFSKSDLSPIVSLHMNIAYIFRLQISKFDWDFQSSYDFARASMLENTKNDTKNICIFICSSRLSHQRVEFTMGCEQQSNHS